MFAFCITSHYHCAAFLRITTLVTCKHRGTLMLDDETANGRRRHGGDIAAVGVATSAGGHRAKSEQYLRKSNGERKTIAA